MRKTAVLNTMAVFFNLLSLLAASAATYAVGRSTYTKLAEICTPYDFPPPRDPCRPGGLFDYLFKRWGLGSRNRSVTRTAGIDY